MTHDPDHPERDPALDAAWREHSTEMPPSRLDAAILAAAHRAVGSAPQPVVAQDTGTRPDDAGVRTRAATGPQRWWMPLAAAATIGAVALGILQTMPQHESAIAPSVSDMPARAVERQRLQCRMRHATHCRPRKSETQRARWPRWTLPGHPPRPRLPRQPWPERANSPPSRPRRRRRTASRLPPHRSPRHPSHRPLRTPRRPRRPPLRSPQRPSRFPRRRKPNRDNRAESVDLKNRAARRRHATAAAPPSHADLPARTTARAASRCHRRRPRPGRWRWERPRPTQRFRARAIDIDASIVRIRKLHDEGRLADAAKELLALRQAIPDADGRLPPELRAWAATVKP